MRPSEGKFSVWPLGVGLFIFVLFLLSVRSVVRLVDEPPADFVNVSVSTKGKPNPELAREYWSLAINAVQWKYARSTGLPPLPPPEFQLLPDTARTSANSETARYAYWHKLRDLWLTPGLWKSSYEVDLMWPIRSGRAVVGWIRDFVRESR